MVLSRSSLICNLLDSRPLGDYRQGDRHPYAMFLGWCCSLERWCCGMPCTCWQNGEAEAVLSAIQAQGITRMNGVPSRYLAMAERRAEYDLHTLRAGFVGGAPWAPEQFCRMPEITTLWRLRPRRASSWTICPTISPCRSAKPPL